MRVRESTSLARLVGSMDERSARAAWSRLSEPEDPTVAQWIEERGARRALEDLLAGRVGRSRFAARLERLDVEADLRNIGLVRGRVVIPGDPDWPEGLDDLEVPPVCLWARGELDLGMLRGRSVAIVGSRNSTPYGQEVASSLAAGLARRGWTIVSGAAYGIDAAAHRAAISVDEPTVAVLAGGPERAYPAEHARMLDRIVRDGAVLSESPPGSAPFRSRFLTRNRLIAAMTTGTIVVEAGLRSGSLNTMRHALRVARPVGIVPGPVTSASSAGCNEALRQREGVVVTDVDEVLDLVGRMGEDACPHRSAPLQPDDVPDPQTARVLDVVPRRAPKDLEAIARGCGSSADVVLGALGRLELAGLVERTESGWRKLPRAQLEGAHRSATL